MNLQALLEEIRHHEELLGWLAFTSLVMLFATPVMVAWVVVRLPRDFFRSDSRVTRHWRQLHPRLRLPFLVAKNLFGVVLVVGGLAMLVMPGQGLLTLLIGATLIDFPGKNRLVRWLVRRPAVWRSLNWLRQRAGRLPFERPD